MLLGLSKNAAAPISDSPKIHYFWKNRHALRDIFEVQATYARSKTQKQTPFPTLKKKNKHEQTKIK